MASSPAQDGAKGTPKGRGKPVRDGHLPVSEFLFDRPGAPSPFGDDQTFPLPASALVYRHPTTEH